MPEQVFKSPGYYEREIDLSVRVQGPVGIPAGVIGTAERGPAFVPVTLGSFQDYNTKFGSLSPRMPAGYAVERYLANRFSLTFMRVLGAGSNTTTSHFETTRTQGTVLNAGFRLTASLANSGVDNRHIGAPQFLIARHSLTSLEAVGLPMFTDNPTFLTTGASDEVFLVRGVVFPANDTKLLVLNTNQPWTGSNVDDIAQADANRKFKLVISSSAGAAFSTTDGFAGLKILTCSFDPSSVDYLGKILNTDPDQFATQKHLLYQDFAVDAEVAQVGLLAEDVVVASGSVSTSLASGDTAQSFLAAYGRFDTRYKTPKTPSVISQPFGVTEYDLFRFEALDDGAFANTQYKISILGLKMSSDPRNEYGTFSVVVRTFDDTDLEPAVLEQFTDLNLNPDSDKYVGKVLGDAKVTFSWDVTNEEDQRLIKTGKYPNRSKFVRVVMNEAVERGAVPKKALPFGFRGYNLLNTNYSMTDTAPIAGFTRLAVSGTVTLDRRMVGAVIPPIPFRFKVTRGAVQTSPGWTGETGVNEIVDSRLFWGVKFERNTVVTNSNVANEPNRLIAALTKFPGIEKLDTVVTGTRADLFSANKFTLSKVCFYNSALTQLTSSVDAHMKQAAYIRNGNPDATNYAITDGGLSRVTFASLLQKSLNASDFNRFSDYMKFSLFFYGGYDGTNILHRESRHLGDQATSTEALGGANAAFVPSGFAANPAGSGLANNAVNSYRSAVRLMTDANLINHSVLVIPGIREPFVTDYAADKTRDYALAIFLQDVPYYDSSYTRLFDTTTGSYIDTGKTADLFETRALDNTYAASYFPNVVMDDPQNRRKVMVPASVAALSAIGFNDKVAYPWYAPAGFNRASLDWVTRTQTKVNQPERDRLKAARINPIVKFPTEGFVVWGQRTLEQAQSALNLINVQRMLINIKKKVIDIGNRLVFEQVDASTRERFVKAVAPEILTIQVKQGIEQALIICDDTNNTADDENNNHMRAQIRIKPTKAFEFVAMDFIISPSGVELV